MHIEDDKDMNKWIGGTLEEMRAYTIPSLEERCPHCGCAIRYPLIARKRDIDLFTQMIATAHEVMDKHGITANLLADIRTQCVIAIAKKHDA